MLDSAKQLLIVVVVGIAAFPVASWVVAGLQTANGATGGPLLMADHGVAAMLRVLLAFAAFGALALAAGRLTHRDTGVFALGLTWILVCIETMPIDDVFRLLDDLSKPSSGYFWLMAIETVIWAVPAALIVIAMARFAPSRYPDEAPHRSTVSINGTIAALALTLLLGWVLVRSNLKGQTTYGIMAAHAFAVMAVRLAVPNCCGAMLALIPGAVGVIAMISSAIVTGDDALLDMAQGALWPLARVLPIEYVGAGTAGVSLGISLARSFSADDVDASNPNAAAN